MARRICISLPRGIAVAALAAWLVAGCSTAAAAPASSSPGLHIGVVLPLSGMPAQLAGQERLGIELAADLTNADGGIHGRQIALDVHDLSDTSQAAAVVAEIKADGASVVVGSYASDLSMAVSAATANAGLVYWESGAVADQLTGRGLPMVFRVGADGARLGANSATFAATLLAARLGVTASTLRVTIVAATDDYARSVADAAQAGLAAEGAVLADRIDYSLTLPNWPLVLQRLVASRPDVVILAAHIPDGEAFRRAMIAANVHVGALIGSTMAQCVGDFGEELGADAIGVFASDRPTGGFNPTALEPSARTLYDRFAAVWAKSNGSTQPTEEGLAGFTAAWALFHDVLPNAAGLDPASIAAAARAVNLPEGSLPNGSGLRFSTDPTRLGQNELAAAVIWQWQAAKPAPTASAVTGGGSTTPQSVTVWPAQFASGPIDPSLVPLPR
ncbi:MAG: ABC transporter substrate-binding protein [Candidatus Limnocylindrales bacterium]